MADDDEIVDDDNCFTALRNMRGQVIAGAGTGVAVSFLATPVELII